jgi:hypothetical protein
MIKTDFQLKIRDLITNPKYDSLEPNWKKNRRDNLWYVVDWEGLVNEILEKGYNLNELSIEMEHGKAFLNGASAKGARLRAEDVDILEDLTGINVKQYATVFVHRKQRNKEASNETKPRPKSRPKVFPKRRKQVLRVDDGTVFASLTEAAKSEGVSPASLSVCIRKEYKCNGKTFKYIKENE